MDHRNHIPNSLRSTFSQLHKLIEQKQFIRGSLVYLRNTCGKENCKCAKGERHVSLYIRQSKDGKPKTTLIPKANWDKVKKMNKRYKEIQDLLEKISVYEWEHIKDKD